MNRVTANSQLNTLNYVPAASQSNKIINAYSNYYQNLANPLNNASIPNEENIQKNYHKNIHQHQANLVKYNDKKIYNNSIEMLKDLNNTSSDIIHKEMNCINSRKKSKNSSISFNQSNYIKKEEYTRNNMYLSPTNLTSDKNISSGHVTDENIFEKKSLSDPSPSNCYPSFLSKMNNPTHCKRGNEILSQGIRSQAKKYENDSHFRVKSNNMNGKKSQNVKRNDRIEKLYLDYKERNIKNKMKSQQLMKSEGWIFSPKINRNTNKIASNYNELTKRTVVKGNSHYLKNKSNSKQKNDKKSKEKLFNENSCQINSNYQDIGTRLYNFFPLYEKDIEKKRIKNQFK